MDLPKTIGKTQKYDRMSRTDNHTLACLISVIACRIILVLTEELYRKIFLINYLFLTTNQSFDIPTMSR